MGPQMVERRLKTLRRLFHPLPAEVWSMLKNTDAYFHFSILLIFSFARAERKRFYIINSSDLKKWQMLKHFTTLIQFFPRRGVTDAYLQRRQFQIDE